MCSECWGQHGSPKIDSSSVRDAVAKIARVYNFYATGGGLHIVVDDFNIDDGSIDFCLARPLSTVERKCGETLRAMTVPERAAAIGWRYWHRGGEQ